MVRRQKQKFVRTAAEYEKKYKNRNTAKLDVVITLKILLDNQNVEMVHRNDRVK